MIKNGSKLLLANQTEAQKAFGKILEASKSHSDKYSKQQELRKKSDKEIERLRSEKALQIKLYDEQIEKEQEKAEDEIRKLNVFGAQLELKEKIGDFCDRVKVSNEGLASLLESITDKKWKVIAGKNISNPCSSDIVWLRVFSEENKHFNEVYEGMNIPIEYCFGDAASLELIYYKFPNDSSINTTYENLKNTNWTRVYLATKYKNKISKAGLSTFTIDSKTYIGRTIYRALENYINSLVENTESDGENE